MNTGRLKFFEEIQEFGFNTEDCSTKEHFAQSSGLIHMIHEYDYIKLKLLEIKKELKQYMSKLFNIYAFILKKIHNMMLWFFNYLCLSCKTKYFIEYKFIYIKG